MAALSPRVVRIVLRTGLLAICAHYLVWGGDYSALDLRRLEQLQVEERTELAAAREQLDTLRAHAHRLESDSATIERVARERFGMIREGELLYRFVSVARAAPPRGRIAASP